MLAEVLQASHTPALEYSVAPHALVHTKMLAEVAKLLSPVAQLLTHPVLDTLR